MKSELVVDVQPTEITTAFVEDGRLAEINREPREMNWSVGNIYYGRIKKVMPALNAAFVDIGHEKDAFLHYLDLGAQFNSVYAYTQQVVSNKKRLPQFPKTFSEPIVGKLGSIEDILTVGQDILVQIQKEPINTKGPRLTAEISIAGRYMVLIPFNDKVMVSNKIKSETEKKRLRNLVNSIKPKGYGVILRTVAANVEIDELQREINILYKRWEDAVLKLQKAEPVSLISAEIGRTIGIIRDVFNSSFDHIYVNDEQTYAEILDYVELIAPESKNIVRQYTGEQPIFDYFDITRQTKIGLGRTVSFKYGGYLVMEKTEALFVIDVNSGTRKVGEDQEENAMNMNLAAADEIAHQLRLRDIGGIIVIDFIDLSSADNRQKLHEYMRHLMSRDRAKHNVLPLSKFGLMQITRQRVRPAVEVDISEVCPTCHGKGKVQSSILFSDQLEQTIPQMVEKYGKKLRLYVHPYVFAYLSKGWLLSIKWHWRFRYGIKLYEDQSLGFLEYRFKDLKGNVLEVEQPVQTPKKLVFEEEKPIQPKQQEQKVKQSDNKPSEQKVKKTEVKTKQDEEKGNISEPKPNTEQPKVEKENPRLEIVKAVASQLVEQEVLPIDTKDNAKSDGEAKPKAKKSRKKTAKKAETNEVKAVDEHAEPDESKESENGKTDVQQIMDSPETQAEETKKKTKSKTRKSTAKSKKSAEAKMETESKSVESAQVETEVENIVQKTKTTRRKTKKTSKSEPSQTTEKQQDGVSEKDNVK